MNHGVPGLSMDGLYLEPVFPDGLCELDRLRLHVRFLQQRVDALTKTEPMVYATITELREGGRVAVLTFPDGDAEAMLPSTPGKGIGLGATVRALQKSRQIVGPVETDLVGPVGDVTELLPAGTFLVEALGGLRTIRPAGVAAAVGDRLVMDARGRHAIRNIGRAPPRLGGELAEVVTVRAGEVEVKHDNRRSLLRLGDGLEPVKGDTVVMDPQRTSVVRVLGGSASALAILGETGVEWEDVRGQDVAVRKLRAAIERPVQHPDLYLAFKKKRPRGVCVYGPSGVGKTLLGRAAATALARLHGKVGADSAFVCIKGPEIKDKFFGNTEERIRAMFAASRAHYAKHGYPQVVLIDEAESILMSRQLRQAGSNVDVSIVQMFLAEMDGFEDTGAFFIFATNRVQDLDPAILRKGRIDSKILMSRPTRDKAVEVLVRHLEGRPLPAPAISVAKSVVQDLWNPHYVLYTLRCQDGRNDRHVTLSDTVSGASLEGLVESAVEIALDRCVANSGEEPMLTPLDFRIAVREAYREAHDAGATDAVQEALATVKDFRQLERQKVDFDALPPLGDQRTR